MRLPQRPPCSSSAQSWPPATWPVSGPTMTQLSMGPGVALLWAPATHRGGTTRLKGQARGWASDFRVVLPGGLGFTPAS